jgi:hypothetical protein
MTKMLHPPWKETEIAWLSGIVEGEGYIAKNHPRLRVRMTDEDVIRRCHAFGIGTLRGPIEGNQERNRQPLFEWTVNKRAEFLTVLRCLYPYLGQRRRARIHECLQSINASLTN